MWNPSNPIPTPPIKILAYKSRFPTQASLKLSKSPTSGSIIICTTLLPIFWPNV